MAIDRVLSVIRHDIVNRLNGISGFAELVNLKSADSGDVSEECGRIIAACGEISKILEKMTRFTPEENSGKAETDVRGIVESAVDMLEFGLDDSIRIKTSIGSEKAFLSFEASELQSIILELGSNAGDAMEKDGLLAVSTAAVFLDEEYCKRSCFDLAPGEYLEIRVSDNGPGASGKEAEMFFEPYFTTRGKRDRGLGLTRIFFRVISVKGEIELNTSCGKGAEVVIRLPAG